MVGGSSAPGNSADRPLKRLWINLTALDFMPQRRAATPQVADPMQGSRPGSLRGPGLEVVDRLVQTLLPVVMVLAHTIALEDIPDSFGEPPGPLAEDQERLPGIDHPLVVNPALPLGVDDRQAPDLGEVLGEVGDHLTQVCLPGVGDQQSPRLQDS